MINNLLRRADSHVNHGFLGNLFSTDLRGADMSLIDLEGSLFSCNSLATTEYGIASRIHIVDYNNGSFKEVLSCE